MSEEIDERVVADLEEASEMVRAAVRLFAKHVNGLAEAFVAQIAEDTVEQDRKERLAEKAQMTFLAEAPATVQ